MVEGVFHHPASVRRTYLSNSGLTLEYSWKLESAGNLGFLLGGLGVFPQFFLFSPFLEGRGSGGMVEKVLQPLARR